MNSPKTDRRVKYSKMALRQSLLEHMKHKQIDNITVTEICKTADINRGTFYAHYNDPRDLLEQIEDDLFQELTGTLEKRPSGQSEFNDYDMLLEIFSCIAANSEVCKILLGKYGDTDFLRRIIIFAQERWFGVWMQPDGKEQSELYGYIFTYIANGSVGIIQRWIQGGMKESPQEIANIVDRLVSSGMRGVAE